MANNDYNIDPGDFRRALSTFATGVAVVTTRYQDEDAGMTVSSFNSVSIDPPLVLWSIGKDGYSYEPFMKSDYFAVNVLAMQQEPLSDRFAQTGTDKFEGLECRRGIGGVPVLPDYAACFECSIEHRYDGGDHTILVGRVLRIDDRETEPLIIYRGRFLRKEGPNP